MALEVTMDEGPDASSVCLEKAEISMRSMIFGIFEPPWKFALTPEFLAKARDFMLPDTFATSACDVRRLAHVHGTEFGFECLDSSHRFKVGHFVGGCLARRPFLTSLHWEIEWCRHPWKKHALVGTDAT